ncbi:MAG: hypothetical protein EOO68_32030, partial [Moraxellaceae bacterium]
MCTVLTLLILAGCGGGSGSGGGQYVSPASQALPTSVPSSKTESSAVNTSASSVSVSSSSVSSITTTTDTVTLRGTVTYDYVPHHANHIGLNYSAIEKRPVRGALVELMDDAGQVKAFTSTNDEGNYTFTE